MASYRATVQLQERRDYHKKISSEIQKYEIRKTCQEVAASLSRRLFVTFSRYCAKQVASPS
jgi:hypothetical protein